MAIGSIGLDKVSPGHLRKLVIAFLAAANAIVIILAGYSLLQAREQDELRAQTQTQNMALAVDYALSNSIDKIDLALKAVTDELQRELSQGGIAPGTLSWMTGKYLEQLPEAEAIRISDARGQVIFGKGLDPKAGASWADRDYFSYLREHPEAGLHVSPPRMGRVARKLIVGFTRRYNYPDGTFAGVISASIALDHFDRLLASFDIRGQGALVLRDANLGLIARYPTVAGPAGEAGSTQVSARFQELFRSGVRTATYDAVLASDQREWTVTYRRIGAAPMVVLAGVAKEDYLAEWRTELATTVLMVLGFMLLSALSGWAVLHLQARMARESSRNRLYLRHASDGIHILDGQGNLLEASDQFCKQLGYGREELIGRNLCLWEAGWPVGALQDQVLPGWLDLDEATCFETYHRRKDGTLIDVEVNIASFEMDGRSCLFAAAREIGEKKRQQQALLHSQALLRQSEERYRLLLQNSPVGILHYDPDLVVTFVNDRFEEIMQVPRGHMAGLDCKKLQDQSVVPAMRHAITGIISRYEGPYVTTYGQVPLWISTRCAPVMTPKGKILGGIVILEDITERKRIEDKERRQRESLAKLNEVAAYSHLPLEEQLQEALAIGTRHLELEFGIVSRIRGNDYEVYSHASPPDTLHRGQVFPFARTYCQITLEQGGVVSIADMSHSTHQGHPCYQDLRLETYIGAPIQVGAQVFGTVNFSSPQPYHRPFDEGDEEFVSLLARWIGSAIERDQAESRLRLAASVFNHAHEGIMICDAGQAILDVNPTFSEITGYGRQEIIGRTPRFLSSGRQNSEFYRAMWQAIQENGHWEGEVWNRRKDGSSYAERLTISSVLDDNGQVAFYIGTFSDISLLKRHQAELERLAHYDPLTHLPNRALLSDRLAQALAQSRRGSTLVAVCYLDLDGFKAINDELGHDAGDILLIEIAQRLQETIRAGDTVARLGGDEFVLLLVGVDGREECEWVANRVLRAIAAPVPIKGQKRTVSGSLGIALFPHDGDDSGTLLRRADQAMYRAKQAGKNRLLFFHSSSGPRALDRGETPEPGHSKTLV